LTLSLLGAELTKRVILTLRLLAKGVGIIRIHNIDWRVMVMVGRAPQDVYSKPVFIPRSSK